MIANGCPSIVQVLYENAAAIRNADIRENGVGRMVKLNAKMPKTKGGKGASAKDEAQVLALQDGDDTAEKAMSKLTAQWYNAVCAGCGLDPTTFQLIQGATPIGSTSETLWNMLDVVPPLSVSNYYNPAQSNVFSTDYGAVINKLKPQNADSFQNDMGDYYAQWTSYLATVTELPQGGILALFQTWSQLHMPPEQAQQCYTDYQQVAQGAVPVAVQMWLKMRAAEPAGARPIIRRSTSCSR